MYGHYNKVFLSFLLFLLTGTAALPAASLRWVHLGTRDAGLVDMEIDGKVAYRKMPPGRATPWATAPLGLHRFRIGTEKNHGSSFELVINENQKITIVSFSDKNGDLQSRTFGLEKPQGDLYVLNLVPGAMMAMPEAEQKAIFGKGFWLPGDQPKNTLSLGDADGFKGEVTFSRLGESLKKTYFAVLFIGEDGKPNLAILRDSDSLFEVSAEPIVVANEMAAGIRIISKGNVVASGGFDPAAINWEEVKSQIFWLNLTIGRDPCRLEIKGFPAMRRMPSGRGSGFVKWPAGDWGTEVVVERTNEKLASNSFSLAAKASIGLISSGGGKYTHRLLTLEGRIRQDGESNTKPRIRFVNALPDGILRSVVKYDPKPLTVTLNPGDTSDMINLEKGGFPGATLEFTHGGAKKQLIGKIPPMPSMPPGDWVVIIHLDKESFSAPVLTWVEMDKGAITSPVTDGREE